MLDRRDRRAFVIVIGVVLALGAAIIVPVLSFRGAETQYIEQNGVTTQATPTGNIVDSDIRSIRTKWRLEFEFTVDGVRYTALGKTVDNVKRNAEARLQKIDQVTVTYLPEDPKRYIQPDDYVRTF